jgi:hypothetical protein
MKSWKNIYKWQKQRKWKSNYYTEYRKSELRIDGLWKEKREYSDTNFKKRYEKDRTHRDGEKLARGEKQNSFPRNYKDVSRLQREIQPERGDTMVFSEVINYALPLCLTLTSVKTRCLSKVIHGATNRSQSHPQASRIGFNWLSRRYKAVP